MSLLSKDMDTPLFFRRCLSPPFASSFFSRSDGDEAAELESVEVRALLLLSETSVAALSAVVAELNKLCCTDPRLPAATDTIEGLEVV